MMRRLLIRLAVVAVALLATGEAGWARSVHALLMGFDHYQNKVSLTGSQNDALELASVLRKRGVSDLAVIDGGDTKRDQVIQAWSAMSQRAQPGDLLIVSFSGHGNKSPERGEPKHRPDGMDKGFLLPAYDEAKFPEEQLRDENLYDLFKAASDRGLKIIFIADACHSGSAVRGIGVPGATPRFQRFQTHGQPLPHPPPPTAVVRRPPIAGLTVYSAADEDQTIMEFTINEQRHGVLSYVVARGLEGAAVNPDGVLTNGGLARYVITNVRLRSNNTQIPSASTQDPDGTIFTTASVAKTTSTMPALSTIAFFSDATPAVDTATIKQVADQRTAELSWSSNGEVRNGTGDLVVPKVGANAVQGAIDTRRVIDGLATTIGQTGGALRTSVAATGKSASDRYYVAGEKIRISAEKTDLRYLTVVDLNADGTVQVLWPAQGDPLEWVAPEAPGFEVSVTPPFGSDTVIFVESSEAMTGLHAQLADLNQKQAPTALYDALRLWLPRTRARLGLQQVFTCATVKGDGSCQ